jgi:cystathionine beta-lyase
MAPSKTYNIAGLDCSVAIVTDPALRKTIEGARDGLVGGVNILGFKAAMAAYEHGEPWLQEALAYLEGNRDFLVRYVQENMPGIEVWSPEGTYLAWLRCAGMPDPACFFLERAKVAVNEGRSFGLGGPEHVRLNFGCARATLLEALDRMCRAWHERDAA